MKIDGEKSSCVVVAGGNTGTVTDTLKQTQQKALEALAELGANGATSGEWRKASGLKESTYQRARDELHDGGFVDGPSEPTRGARYKLTKQGKNAVTTK